MTKDDLRRQLRTARRDHVAALPASMRTLVFMRPPAPLLEPARHAALVKLPLFETCAGGLVSLEAPRFLLLERHPFFTPSEAQASSFLRPDSPPVVMNLLEALNVRRLTDADVFEHFLLPAFGSLSPVEQAAQRAQL